MSRARSSVADDQVDARDERDARSRSANFNKTRSLFNRVPSLLLAPFSPSTHHPHPWTSLFLPRGGKIVREWLSRRKFALSNSRVAAPGRQAKSIGNRRGEVKLARTRLGSRLNWNSVIARRTESANRRRYGVSIAGLGVARTILARNGRFSSHPECESLRIEAISRMALSARRRLSISLPLSRGTRNPLTSGLCANAAARLPSSTRRFFPHYRLNAYFVFRRFNKWQVPLTRIEH